MDPTKIGEQVVPTGPGQGEVPTGPDDPGAPTEIAGAPTEFAGTGQIEIPVVKGPIHPNDYVAVATARIRLHEIETIRTNKFIEDFNRGDTKDTRFTHLLDGLASLCVQGERAHVVAVALTITEAGAMNFTIAQNGGNGDKTTGFLTTLLDLLKGYSCADVGKCREKELEIMKLTYTHAAMKIRSRLQKRRWLRGMEKALHAHVNLFGGTSRRCLDIVTMLIDLAELLLEAAPESKIEDDKWIEIFWLMDVAMEDVRRLLDHDKEICGDWATELIASVNYTTGTNKPVPQTPVPVPLYRAIEKLTSHHRYVHQLLTYARSPSGIADLTPVTKVTYKFIKIDRTQFPASEEVKHIVKPLVPEDNFTSELTKLGVGIDILFKSSEPHNYEYNTSAHCECFLIYLLSPEPQPKTGPYWYIGVSKLSCAPCHLWIQAFNATHSRQFYTRGTHGKWYLGWAMPTMQGDKKKQKSLALMDDDVANKLGEAMIELVKDAYSVHAAGQPLAIELSDSTEAKQSSSSIFLTDIGGLEAEAGIWHRSYTGEELKKRLEILNHHREARFNQQ